MNPMPGQAFFCLWAGMAFGVWVAGSGSVDFDRVVREAGAEAGAPSDAGRKPATTQASRQAERANLLLIGLETLRADHVRCLGYEKDTTPTLDRLAREGVLCARTMSTSGWTLPSVMSVMTSLYPDAHQTYTCEHRLSEQITTLAEVLKANGYSTVGVVSNPIVDGRYGFADGFDLYDDFTVSLDCGLNLFERHDESTGVQHLAGTSELVTRTAVKWLEQNSGEPLFMFAFYVDPHYDYVPPVRFEKMFDPNYEGSADGRGVHLEPRRSRRPADRDLQHLLALYDGEIRYTDTWVAELLQAFERLDLLDNTLVVLFGDHGDEFYEHGKTAHDRTLYNEIIHVPLILWWPEQLPAGKRVDATTSLIDIMPTILDYLAIPYNGFVQGVSLRPSIEGSAGKLHDTVWAELNTWIHVQAVMNDSHKLIRNVSNDSWELYDLANDPREHANLFDQPSARDARLALTAEWERWTRDNGALAETLARGTETKALPLTEERLRQLKALGYAQ